jgi:hypothetical protein
MYIFRVVLLLALSLPLGCSACDPVTPDGEGEGEGEAGEGEGEGEGEACTPGEVGCACNAGACDVDADCIDDVCVACPAGTSECACDNDTCLDDLVCDGTTARCRDATACDVLGCVEHQQCSTDGDAVCLPACDDGYDFIDDLCVPGASCDADAPGALVCAVGVACVDDADGVRCEGCDVGFVDVNGSCLPEDDCSAFCGVGQDCGFRTINGVRSAECLNCLPGFVSDGSGGCVDRVTCDELACAAPAVCVDATATIDAVCRTPASCGAAEVDDGSNNCIACVHCFDDNGAGPVARPGVVGIGNGGLASGNKCVCQLAEGFFQSVDDGTVKTCDSDDDGWTSADLLPVLRLDGGNNPFAREQRCTVRTADRFHLVADLPEVSALATSTLVVTVAELVRRYNLPTSSFEGVGDAAFVSLFEPEQLDIDDELARRYQSTNPRTRLRAYQTGLEQDGSAQRFRAAEANPLTKSCNHDQDDLNEDSFADVVQSHDVVPGTFTSPLEAAPVWYRMAHFIELHRSAWISGEALCAVGERCHGAIEIREKDRVGELDLTFADRSADGVVADYWQQCVRGRDVDYAGTAAINFDFAGFATDCTTPNGGCFVSTDLDGDGEGDTEHIAYDGRAVRETAAIADRPIDLDADGLPRWPGMTHHSQFKCTSAAGPRPTGDVNHCSLSRTSHAPVSTVDPRNPFDPAFVCTADGSTTIPTGFNSFVAVLGDDDVDNDYQHGCIAEGHEWAHLCAASAPGDTAALTNLELMYGQLFCACGANRAGARCEVGCGDEQRLQSGADTSILLVAGQPTLSRTWSCMQPVVAVDTLRAGNMSVQVTVPSEAMALDPVSGVSVVGGVRSSISAPR